MAQVYDVKVTVTIRQTYRIVAESTDDVVEKLVSGGVVQALRDLGLNEDHVVTGIVRNVDEGGTE